VHHHRLADVLGKVLSLEEDDIGVKMTAKLMRQPEGSPLRWIYEAVRDGYMRGLSARAFWDKAPLSDGTKAIIGTGGRIVECSITAAPALSTTAFEVVSEGKALEMVGVGSLTDTTGVDLAMARLRLNVMRAESAAVSGPRRASTYDPYTGVAL
jgi:hypothetical protein